MSYSVENHMNMIDPNKTYRIMSLNSGKVLDVKGASPADGAEIIQFAWHNGNNQKWIFIPLQGEDNGYYEIVSANSGKCLDVEGASAQSGTGIIQYTFKNGKDVKNQQWKVDPVFDPRYIGAYRIVSKFSQKVLDVNAGSLDDGAKIIEFDQHTGLNQMWIITVVE